MPDPNTYTPSELADEVQILAENYRGAVAEIEEDNGYFADISTAVQGKTGQVAPYDKDELASAIDGIDTFTFPIDENSEVSVLVPGINQDGFYLSSNPNDKTDVSFGVDENNNLYVIGGSVANA